MATEQDLEPHADMIIKALSEYRSPGQICIDLSERGVHAEAADVVAFREGKHRKAIEKARAKTLSELPVMSTAFLLMQLNDIICSEQTSTTEKLSAMRIRTMLVKQRGNEMTAEELMGDDS